jgi:hypothetical protein
MTGISFSYAVADFDVSNSSGSFQRDLNVRPSYRVMESGCTWLECTLSAASQLVTVPAELL